MNGDLILLVLLLLLLILLPLKDKLEEEGLLLVEDVLLFGAVLVVPTAFVEVVLAFSARRDFFERGGMVTEL